jgi:hypothetical protein
MAGSPRSSAPSSSGEPSLRRLGVGSRSGADRPLRAQLVVAGVLLLVLAAVPLYLVRRPSGAAQAEDKDAGSDGAAAASAAAPPSALVPKPPERLKLGSVTRVRCGNAPNAGNDGSLCDSLPAFEQALVNAVRSTVDCAPKTQTEGSINYVLNIDFSKKKLHVFPGASGSWRGPQARRAAQCVKRAIVPPDWATISHQHRHYAIAVLATYRPPSALRDPTAPPVFE